MNPPECLPWRLFPAGVDTQGDSIGFGVVAWWYADAGVFLVNDGDASDEQGERVCSRRGVVHQLGERVDGWRGHEASTKHRRRRGGGVIARGRGLCGLGC